MTSVVGTRDLVAAAVSAAMAQALPAELAGGDPLIRRSEHADFQSTVALSVARTAGRPAREVAAAIAGAVDSGLSATVAGPGFLNLTLPDAAVWAQVARRLAAARLGVVAPRTGERIVVDYSGFNIAREPHVGHLRTTIIGDALVRILRYLGAEVIPQNHLGDWGTQFGMLVQFLMEHPDHAGAPYPASRALFDADPAFADRARSRVVALQAGDPATLAMWQRLVGESEEIFQQVYDRLGVLLTPADSAGESTYNPMLHDVVDELVAKGIAVRSAGALCVFFPGVEAADGSPVPLIVRKDDGGFGYAATDLAAVRHRIRHLRADRILYVVDARQALHFRMVFETARRAGWLPEGRAVHVPFGTVLAADGRPFRTRAGGTVRLLDLLDEAEAKVRVVMGDGAEPALVRKVSMGAVKYAELSTSRLKDYAFDVERMVSYTGNTGVYLQYAHVRARSILAKAPDASTVDTSLPVHPVERALALALDEFTEVLDQVAETLEPHHLCGYLYALARTFTTFFESAPVLKAETPQTRDNRLALCLLTARTMEKGLDLLGIAAPARM